MIAIDRLRVSLTKHGAHKIAQLLARYDAQDVLSHLSDSITGVNIESVQAHKNLSASGTGVVPGVWNQARAAGRESIDALVLIAIIFSHGQLIKAMRTARTAPMRGTITRGQVLDEKAFTNFAHTIEELGYSTSHTSGRVSYDLTKLFRIPGLHHLATEVLTLKLRTAGWDRSNSLAQEMISYNLHEVFAISSEQLSNWLATGDIDSSGIQAFFSDAEDADEAVQLFEPTSGYAPRQTGEAAATTPPTSEEADPDSDEDTSLDGIDNDEHRLRAIKTRRGQYRFRQRLLDAYSRRCVITNCSVEALLEAAHITPHAELTDYNVSNGLLLRADIHTLFDLDLITVDDFYTIKVSERLRNSEYWVYNDRRLERLPDLPREQPNRDALRRRTLGLKTATT